jgi:MFS family permease
MSVNESSVHVAVLTGRPLGGLLFGAAPLVPVLANVALIAGFLVSLRRVEQPPAPGPGRRPPEEGIQPHDHQFIRVATWLVAALNLIVQALLIVVIATAVAQDLPHLLTGLVLAASGLGGLVGSLTAPVRERLSGGICTRTSGRPLFGRLAGAVGLTGQGRSTLVVQVWLWVVAFVLAALMNSPVFFFFALLLIGMGGGLSNVTIRSVIGRLDQSLVARVTGEHRLVTYGASALGPLFGTVLVAVFGEHTAVFVLLGLTVVIAGLVTWVPVLRGSLASGRVGDGRPALAAAPGQPDAAGQVERGPGGGLADVSHQARRQAAS